MQQVRIKGELSDIVSVESGVPQGSVISGLLFIIFINDLAPHLKHCKISLYADDAKFYSSVVDAESLKNIQEDIDRITKWCKEWRLKLNIQKCCYIHYTPKNSKKIFQPHYTMNGEVLRKEAIIKDLGILITEDLKFHTHIDKIAKNANREINRIRRTFISRSPNFLRDLYIMYVRPKIEYCIELWNPEYKLDQDKLEKVQNKMTRLLKFGKIMEPNERNKMMNIPSHYDRRVRGDMINIYKNINNQEYFKTKDESAKRCKRNSKYIIKIVARTDIKSHTFTHRNINIWNSLPDSIVTAKSVNIFKSRYDAQHTEKTSV